MSWPQRIWKEFFVKYIVIEDEEYVGKSGRLGMPSIEFVNANKLSKIRGQQQDDSKMKITVR